MPETLRRGWSLEGFEKIGEGQSVLTGNQDFAAREIFMRESGFDQFPLISVKLPYRN